MTQPGEQQGGCMCGAVRFAVTGPPIWSAGCTCRECARATGAPYVVWVGFPPERVRFLAGAPRIHRSSEGVLRGFCAECGTTLTYGREPAFEAVEPTLYIAASTFDDPEAYPPTEVVWYARRPAWFALADGIPLHPTTSPENAARSYAVARQRT